MLSYPEGGQGFRSAANNLGERERESVCVSISPSLDRISSSLASCMLNFWVWISSGGGDLPREMLQIVRFGASAICNSNWQGLSSEFRAT